MRSLVGQRDRKSLAGKPASAIRRATEKKRMTSPNKRVVEGPNFELKASLLLRSRKSKSRKGQEQGRRGQGPSESKSE